MKRTLKATYIDTCYIDYLTDHYNKEDRYLCSISAFSNLYDNMEDLVDSLVEDANYHAENLWDFSDIEIKKALVKELNNYSLDLIVDNSISEPGYDEGPSIFVLIEVLEIDLGDIE